MDISQSLGRLARQTQPPTNTLDIIIFYLKTLISAIGTIVIICGVIVCAYRFLVWWATPKQGNGDYLQINVMRRDLGLTIILGLEFIIAADVIETTTIPDYYTLGILGIIVVIRTFLSYTLNKEVSKFQNFFPDPKPVTKTSTQAD